jgi:transposase InsO family protein
MPRTKSKEPPSPVSQERALEHSLLTLRRAWACDIQDFSRFATSVADPKPLAILDLNGQELFYLFDQGTQYGCDAWRRFCRSNHLEPSMSRKGNCWDNAVAESFFSSLKKERIRNRSIRTESWR